MTRSPPARASMNPPGPSSMSYLSEMPGSTSASYGRTATTASSGRGRPPLYEVRPDGMWWNKRVRRDGETRIEPTRLCNFHATITAEITKDDGSGKPRKFLDMRAVVAGEREVTFTIPAEEFMGMQW